MSLRVGIVGAGQAGERQAIGFAAHPDAEVVGIADLDEARGTALAATLGAASVREWRDLFALGVDVLVVALPHDQHVVPAEEAARQGVHVVMEKPIATTLDDAQRIVRACRDADVQLALSFVHRFREEVVRAKAWLELAGAPQVARESMASQRTSAHPRWITRRQAAGGGVLMYGAIHGVDRLRWFLGSEVLEVDARTRRYAPDTEVEDGVAALLTFANGAVATLSANAPLYPAQPTPWETEVYCTRAMVRMRTGEFAETSGEEGANRYITADDPATALPYYHFARQAADIVAAIEAHHDPSVTGEDGLRTLEVCLAVYRSAETGQSVLIEDVRKEQFA